MKNRKSSKLIILALSLALLIGAAVGIAASAADEDLSVDIIAHNVEYGETVNVLFAVDNTNTDGKAVEIVYYLDDPDTNPNATPYIGSSYAKGYTEDDTTYPAFITAGFPIKEIWRPVYAKAHIVGTDVYSDTLKYSVTQYLNERLYLATGVSENKLAFYKSMLETATLAQKVLINENSDPADDIAEGYFVSDHSLVTIEGGTLDGAGSLGMYFKGETVIPSADGVNYWIATTYAADGSASVSAVANNKPFTVKGRTVFEVNNIEAIDSYYDYYADTKAKGWSFDSEFDSTQAMGNANYVKRNGTGNSFKTDDFDTSDITKYSEILKFTTVESNRVFEFRAGYEIRCGFHFRRHSVIDEGYNDKHLVFESKLKLDINEASAQAILDAGSNYIMSVSISETTAGAEGSNYTSYKIGTEVARIYVSKDADGNYHYYYNAVGAGESSLAEITNGWNTVTTEIDLSAGTTGICTAKTYVNGILVGQMSFNGADDAALVTSANPTGVYITYNSTTGNAKNINDTSVFFDDVFCTYAPQPE